MKNANLLNQPPLPILKALNDRASFSGLYVETHRESAIVCFGPCAVARSSSDYGCIFLGFSRRTSPVRGSSTEIRRLRGNGRIRTV